VCSGVCGTMCMLPMGMSLLGLLPMRRKFRSRVAR